jgi:aminodeoxyfutalosine deaminase
MKPTVHKAGWIMVKPEIWLENGAVEVLDGRITAIFGGRVDGRITDHGPGVIMRALINAHTHLSLSALHGRILTGNGFVDWVRDLIQIRAGLSYEDISTAAVGAARDMRDSGTGLVAEVGPLEPGASAIKGADVDGILFTEVLGNRPAFPVLPRDTNGVSFSFAGHGLHTTDPATLKTLRDAAIRRNNLFTLHLAESEAETEFLDSGHGPWADLVTSRGIDISTWDIRGERPVQRADRLGLLSPKTLAVHLLEVNREDVRTLAETGTSICLCPRSNLALHGRLPDINGFLATGLAPALGTDSLASNSSLSMFEEMAFLHSRYLDLKPKTILAMATTNASRALGRTDLGTAEPGQKARLIYVDLAANSGDEAALKLVSEKPQRVDWL